MFSTESASVWSLCFDYLLLCNKLAKLSDLNNKQFVVLIDSVGQKLRNWAGITQRLGSAGTISWGACV